MKLFRALKFHLTLRFQLMSKSAAGVTQAGFLVTSVRNFSTIGEAKHLAVFDVGDVSIGRWLRITVEDPLVGDMWSPRPYQPRPRGAGDQVKLDQHGWLVPGQKPIRY